MMLTSIRLGPLPPVVLMLSVLLAVASIRRFSFLMTCRSRSSREGELLMTSI